MNDKELKKLYKDAYIDACVMNVAQGKIIKKLKDKVNNLENIVKELVNS